ncbi:MAG: hypothetical protein OXB88_05775 [Bacteriovoracales bacterium]|nr:hypothetical protein [Bacteriovoracales bacterium]
MKEVVRCSFILWLVSFVGCSSFQAERVGRDESDEKALSITDEWLMKDTENTVTDLLKQIEKHRGFRQYLKKLGRRPKIFVADVQNRTSEPYFPVDDLNDELLNELSSSGEYILIDESVRMKILREIQYQNDGMVAANQAKSMGRQAGADLMIFGAIRMSPKSRKGRTIKEYSVNMRMTDITSGVEVMRTRVKVNKYSKKGRIGW